IRWRESSMNLDEMGLPDLAINKRVNLSEHVITVLKDAILSGALPPGSRLVEDQLAKMLNVSKTPLREALGALEKEGLVKSSPYQGRSVAFISPAQLSEIYEVREVLEGLAARLAAEHATPELDKKLEQCILMSEQAVKTMNTEEFLHYDREFHRILVEASQNETLRQMHELLRYKIMLGQVNSAYGKQRKHESISEHLEVLKAIQSRNPNDCEAAMRRHIANLTSECPVPCLMTP
ncbi:MAG TPA: GntR family transcriptional regulator, partial [Desulfosporosinus sp.]|nr:GntR family transcriptional regulator [Desulfosporosinus sp.]